MLRRRPGAGRGPAVSRPARPARYSGARIRPGPPVRGTAARVAHLPAASGLWVRPLRGLVGGGFRRLV